MAVKVGLACQGFGGGGWVPAIPRWPSRAARGMPGNVPAWRYAPASMDWTMAAAPIMPALPPSSPFRMSSSSYIMSRA